MSLPSTEVRGVVDRRAVPLVGRVVAAAAVTATRGVEASYVGRVTGVPDVTAVVRRAQALPVRIATHADG